MNLHRLLSLSLVLLLAVTASMGVSSCSSPEALYDTEEASDYAVTDDSYYSREKGDAGTKNVYDYDMADDRYVSNSYGSESAGLDGHTGIRYVIRSGSLRLTVELTHATVVEIQQIVKSLRGYISESRINEFREGFYSANLTLRIPSDQFDRAMEQLQDLGKATDIYTSEDDTTFEYLDLEARIRNLKAQEERLLEILEMAVNIEEVLVVEKELNRVRSEIEVLTSRFNYLKNLVSYSTIEVSVQDEEIATQVISPAPFENLGSRMKEALVRTVNTISGTFARLLVSITSLLPYLAILVIPVALIWYGVARRKKRTEITTPDVTTSDTTIKE